MPPEIGGHPLSGLFVIVRTHLLCLWFLCHNDGNRDEKEQGNDRPTISEKFRINRGYYGNDD